MRDSAGHLIEGQRIEIPLASEMGMQQPPRVAIPAGSQSAIRADPWDAFSPQPPAWVEVPASDILDGPALEFASCDWIAVPESLRGQLTKRQARTLLAAGIRIAIFGDAAPPEMDAVSSWQRANDAAGNGVWISPPPVRRATVLEPGLADLTEWRKPASAGPADERITFWLPPLAIVLVILGYGLFRRRWVVLLAWAVALLGLSVATIAYEKSHATIIQKQADWTESQILASAPGSPSIALRESLRAESTVFSRREMISPPADFAAAPALVFPVAASSREYWNLRSITLNLSAGENEPSHLEAELPARSVFFYEIRAIVPASQIAQSPAAIDPAATTPRIGPTAPLVEVRRLSGAFSGPDASIAPGRSRGHRNTFQRLGPIPAASRTRFAWRLVRRSFAAPHEYLVVPPGGSPGLLQVIDFGSAP